MSIGMSINTMPIIICNNTYNNKRNNILCQYTMSITITKSKAYTTKVTIYYDQGLLHNYVGLLHFI